MKGFDVDGRAEKRSSSSRATKARPWLKAGISQATYFNWKKKCAGLMPSEMRRLRDHWFLSLEGACEKLEAWRRHHTKSDRTARSGIAPRSCWQTQPVKPAHRIWERRKTPDPSGPRLGSSAGRFNQDISSIEVDCLKL